MNLGPGGSMSDASVGEMVRRIREDAMRLTIDLRAANEALIAVNRTATDISLFLLQIPFEFAITLSAPRGQQPPGVTWDTAVIPRPVGEGWVEDGPRESSLDPAGPAGDRAAQRWLRVKS